MTWKNARKIVDARREAVAHLRLRGLTVREIVEALPKQGMINNETGEPFALATIGADIAYLKKQWQESAAASIAEHKAAQLAELTELKRTAWARKQYKLVRDCLQDEARMLGTNAPTRNINYDFSQLTDEQLERLAKTGDITTSIDDASDSGACGVRIEEAAEEPSAE